MSRAKEVSFVNKSKSARLFTRLCNASNKSQIEIAAESGFEKPNIITMIKQGRVKIPIPRIPALCKALECDPSELLDVVMEENHRELRDVLLRIQGVVANPEEKFILGIMREAKIELESASKAETHWHLSTKNIERLKKFAVSLLEPTPQPE